MSQSSPIRFKSSFSFIRVVFFLAFTAPAVLADTPRLPEAARYDCNHVMDGAAVVMSNCCVQPPPHAESGDTDKDGTLNKCDGCPTDYHKTSPGVCGCGKTEERDTNGTCCTPSQRGCDNLCHSGKVIGCDGICGSGKVIGGCDNQCGSTKVIGGCDNQCGSTKTWDICGVCGGPGFNAAGCCGTQTKGCDNVCGSGKVVGGCDNQCGSTKTWDVCNVCGGSGLNASGCCGTQTRGCDHVCGSGKQNDVCGICGGSGYNASGCCGAQVKGCDNVCGSGKVYGGCDNQCGSTKTWDICGVCGGSGLNASGCCGTQVKSGCDWQCGSTKVDEGCGCGVTCPCYWKFNWDAKKRIYGRTSYQKVNEMEELYSLHTGTMRCTTVAHPEIVDLYGNGIDYYKFPSTTYYKLNKWGTGCVAITATQLNGLRECGVQTYMAQSPISLLWDGAEQEQAGKPGSDPIVQFPLDPKQKDQWSRWKASATKPLLVFDPAHKSKIVDGSQLFGTHAFGKEWEDGYEALATLDKNKNGKVDGKELKDLALWFDGNQDGISQAGEVKSLAEVSVTALYFKPDGTNEFAGEVYVKRGYDRLVDGKTISGGSVDWFAEVYVDKQSAEDEGSSLVPSMPVDPKASAAPKQSLPSTSALSGEWRWSADKEMLGGTPFGRLIFRPSGAMIKGFSQVEMVLKHNPAADIMVYTNALEGTSAMDSQGRTVIRFTLKDGDRITTSVAVLSKDGKLLNGVSRDTAGKDPKTGEVLIREYSWTAFKKAELGKS